MLSSSTLLTNCQRQPVHQVCQLKTLVDAWPKIKKIPWAVKGLKHLLSKEDPRHHEAPQLNLTPDEARWFTLSRVDSATVSTAGGTGVAFRKRDRDLARDLVEQTRELLSDIEDNFDEMRTEYRKALPELTSRESWRKIFE